MRVKKWGRVEGGDGEGEGGKRWNVGWTKGAWEPQHHHHCHQHILDKKHELLFRTFQLPVANNVCVCLCICNTLCVCVCVCVHCPGAGYYYSSSKRRVWLLVRPLASVPVLCGAAGAGWSRRGGGVPALILPLLLMLLLLLLVLRLNSPSITPTTSTSSSPKDSSTI